MTNLQLVDTLGGGYFVFKRNDYPLDQGVYTELYCAFFATRSNWWADTAFEVQSEKISSRTENALKTNNSNSDADIALIKKAVSDDLERFKNKNPEVEVVNAAIAVFANKTIQILVEVSGNTEAFNFIYAKTAESLENIKYEMYDI